MAGGPKKLMLVRHAQSEYNARMWSASTWLSPSFWLRGCDPGVRDVPLTPLGVRQAKSSRAKLWQRLREEGFLLPETTAVLASPLTRALQTAGIMMDYPLDSEGENNFQNSRLGSPASPGLSSNFAGEPGPIPRKIVALPQVRERCFSLGDCGRRAEELQRDFPDVDFAALGDNTQNCDSKFEPLPCRRAWWLPAAARARLDGLRDSSSGGGEDAEAAALRWRPNWLFPPNSVESRRETSERIVEAKRVLLARPESHLVVFGHSMFWKDFMGPGGKKLANCGMALCTLKEDLSVRDIKYYNSSEETECM